MFDSIQRAVTLYTRTPLPFVSVALMHFALQLLVFFALLGGFLIIFFLASLFRLSIDFILASILGILAVVFLYFSSGIKGAALNAYSTIIDGGSISFFGFYNYALANSPRFFILFLIRSLIELVPVGLLAALYFFILKGLSIPYLDVFIGLISSFFIFLIHYLLYGSFISVAVTGSTITMSLKKCFKFVRSTHIFSLLLYTLYSIIWFTQFVPIINIITYFVTFPITYSAMTIYFQKTTRGSRVAAAPVFAKPARYGKRAGRQQEDEEEYSDDE